MKEIPMILLLLAFSGCATHTALISNNSVGTKNEIPVGISRGESAAFYFLGMQLEGDDSVETAIENAITETGADTMSNLAVDLQSIFFLSPFLLRFDNTIVRGTLIKYIPESGSSFLRIKKSDGSRKTPHRSTIAPGLM